MLGEEALRAYPRRTTHQTQDPAADVRKNPIGNVRIEVGQSLLGNSRLRPEHSFRMCEFAPRGLATASSQSYLWRGFEGDPLRRAIFTDAEPDRLANQTVARPAAELDLADEPGRRPAHSFFGTGRKPVAEIG